MKFTCAKDEFQRTLSMTENATTGKSGLPILSNVLIEAKQSVLTIIGTDQEMCIKAECDANIETEGTMTLHAKKMMDILKTFPNCNIQIEADEKYNITVSSLESNINAQFKLQGVSPDEYPDIEKIEEDKVFSIPQHKLRDMIRKTIYAVSREESRHFLQGVYFEKVDENELRLVATDGHRLSLSKDNFDSLNEYEKFGVMNPQKPLNELLKVLENEGDCEIGISDKRGFFRVGRVEISSNFIETEFLNYNSVIPEKLDYKLIAKTETLSDSIKRMASILDAKERRIKFEIRDSYINIYGDNPNLGNANEKVDVTYKGEDIDIGLNYEYMLQTLREIKSENVIIEIGSNVQPIIVKEENDESSLAVIGPMRLNN
jgi:DNA polymerase III subunit beta